MGNFEAESGTTGDSFPPSTGVRRCLGEQDVELYCQGRLTDEQMECVEAHISFCEPCLMRVEQEEAFRAALRQAVEPTPSRASEGPVPREGTLLDRFRRLFDTPWRASLGFAGAALAILLVIPWSRLSDQTVSGEPVSVQLYSLRSANASAAPAHRSLRLSADLRGLTDRSPLRLSIVDATGKLLEEKTIEPLGESAQWSLDRGLAPGAYWLRVSSEGSIGEVLREYPLQVR